MNNSQLYVFMKIISLLIIKKLSRRDLVQQSIKIIAEIIVKMNIVAHIKFSCKLQKSTSAIGYYFYTNRCAACRADNAKLIEWIKKETY